MNIKLLTHLVHLIEEIFKTEAPVAIQAAEQDPKIKTVQAASVELLAAVRNLKAVMDTPSSGA